MNKDFENLLLTTNLSEIENAALLKNKILDIILLYNPITPLHVLKSLYKLYYNDHEMKCLITSHNNWTMNTFQ